MKKINLLNPVSALLLGSAIFFMSCSKEEMFAPKESKANSGAGNQVEAASTAPVTTTENSASKSLPTLPSSSSWTKVTPFTVSHGQTLTVNVVGKLMRLEAYQRPAGSTLSPSFMASVSGNEYMASIFFTAQPGIEYFFKFFKQGTVTAVVWPSMESLAISTSYGFILKGVGPDAGNYYGAVFSISPA